MEHITRVLAAFRINTYRSIACEQEDVEIIFLVLMLQVVVSYFDNAVHRLESLLADHIREQKRLCRPAEPFQGIFLSELGRIPQQS